MLQRKRILLRSGVDYYAYVLSLAPILWYRLRETSGTTVVDSSASGLNGVWTAGAGSVGQTGAGNLGNEAYSFDKADSRIARAASAVLNNASYSVAALCNPTDTGEGAAGTIYYATGGFDQGRFNSSGAWLHRVFNAAGSGFSTIAAAGQVVLGAWQWIFMNYDDAGDRIPRIYIGRNGAAVETTYTASPALTGTRKDHSAIAWNFGNRETSDTTWNGLIDEIIRFNFVLSAAQMAAITQARGI